MALTRPRIGQLVTSVAQTNDPITVLKAGSASANVDVGFLINRASGLVSNVALYWSESGNSFVLSFTNNSGATDANIVATSFANLTIGTLTANTLSVAGGGINGVTIGAVTPAPGTFTTLTSTGILTSLGNVVAGSGTATTGATTGALVVVGGTGISGELHVGGTSRFIGSANFEGNLRTIVVTATTVTANNIGNTSTTLTGTISTNAQPNITSVGTLTGLTSSGVVASTGNIVAGSGTASTNTTTGALVVTGGVGVSGDMFVGGNITAASLNTTETNIFTTNQPLVYHEATPVYPYNYDIGFYSHFIGGTANIYQHTGIVRNATDNYWEFFSNVHPEPSRTVDVTDAIWDQIKAGELFLVNTTPSTSSVTGALRVSGGAGIAGNLHVGSGIQNTVIGNVVPAAGNFTTLQAGLTLLGGNLVAGAGTATTSTVSGALVVVGGAGISGNITLGGSLNATGRANFAGGLTATTISAGTIGNTGATLTGTISTASQPNITSLGTLTSLAVSGVTTSSGNIVATSGTDSTSATTGAVVVSGGVGVSGNVYTNRLYTTEGIYWSGNGYVMSTGGGSAAGSTGQLQYNNGGIFTAAPLYYWSGNTNLTTSSAVYASSLYDNSNRVLTSVTVTAGNGMTGGGTITGASGTVTVSLPTTGPGVVTVGNSTAIPVITTDVYGRITSLTSSAVSTTISLAGTSGTGSVAGGGTLTFAGSNGFTATASGSTITLSTSQDLQTSASPTFAGGNFTGNVTRASKAIVTNYSGNTAPGSPVMGDEWFRGNTSTLYKYIYDNVSNTFNWINISSALYNASTSATANTLALRDSSGNLTAVNFIGIASSAKYADLAEVYASDQNYEPGTVVVFGGTAEITVTSESHDTRVAGVISTNPAYLMNSDAIGLPVAFTGRVPCRVQGPVIKGDVLVTSAIPGVAQRLGFNYQPGCVLGKALGEVSANEIATIEVVVGRF